jgi:hypothetical protein
MGRDLTRVLKAGLPVFIKIPLKLAAPATSEGVDNSTCCDAIEAGERTVEWAISFDPRELEDYRYAVRQLRAAVLLHHGPDTLRRLLAEESPTTKRALQQAKNDRLLAEYVRSGLSVKRCAAKLAEKNKSLPRDYRYGPTGSINKDTLEKHISRQKKLMDQNPSRRAYIQRFALQLAEWAADIS